jgi:hypothetical protein
MANLTDQINQDFAAKGDKTDEVRNILRNVATRLTELTPEGNEQTEAVEALREVLEHAEAAVKNSEPSK